MTIASVKAKLHSHTGTSPAAMALVLKDENNRPIGAMGEFHIDTKSRDYPGASACDDNKVKDYCFEAFYLGGVK
jgi:hypothetical protein